MLMEMEYRRFDEVRGGKGPITLRGTFLESLAIAQIEPQNLELTRAGRRFVLGNSAAVTGIAPVQVLPTTQPQWAIFNNELAGNGRTYWLEELGMLLTAGTPGVGAVLMACLFQTPVPTGANTAGMSVSKAAGIAGAASSSQGSNALVKSSPGAITTPAAPNWYPIAVRPDANVTAFAGSVFIENRNLMGAIAIPPQMGLGLAVVSPAGTTPLFAPFGRWVEIATDLE